MMTMSDDIGSIDVDKDFEETVRQLIQENKEQLDKLANANCEKSGKEVIVCREGCGGIFDSWVVFYEHRCEDTAEGGDGAPDNGSQSRASAALEQETSKAETLEDLRIPEDGSINTLIGKLVAHYLSEDDSPEDVDAHKETYNAAIDHVEDVVRRRKQRVLETGEMPEERKVVRVDELNALLGDVSQKGGME